MRPRITGGLGRRRVAGERCPHRDCLGNWQQPSDVGHRVGGGPDADPTLSDRIAVAGDALLRVEPLGDPGRGPGDLPITQTDKLAGEFFVHCRPIRG